MKHLNELLLRIFKSSNLDLLIQFLWPNASQWSSAAWSDNGAINAALSQSVVHITEPSQTSSRTLSFTAASSNLTVVLVWLSPSTSVTAAADQFVFWTLTAIVSQTTNLTGRTTVLVLAVFPIVEWFSTFWILSGIVSTWASLGSVGVAGIVNTGNILSTGTEVNSFDSVFTVWTWTVVGNGLDVVPFVVVAFFGGPSE
jgi:hypothetical protein